MNSNEIFYQYKATKNKLTKVSIIESLHIIWFYHNNIRYNLPLHREIQTIPIFLQKDYISKLKIINLNVLEVLAREVIIEGQYFPDKSLKKWSYFSSVIQGIKDLEEYIDLKLIKLSYKGSGLHFLTKLAHRQFCWQHNINKYDLMRYLKILIIQKLT